MLKSDKHALTGTAEAVKSDGKALEFEGWVLKGVGEALMGY